MSVTVVEVKKNKIVLVADSIRVRGYTQEKVNNAKIKKVNDVFGFACCGTAKELELFFLFCQSRQPRAADSTALVEFMCEFQEWLLKKTGVWTALENTYLVVFNGHAFSFQDFYCVEVLTSECHGAGEDYALTAMHLGKSAKEAVEVACELCVYCEQPVNVLEFERSAT